MATWLEDDPARHSQASDPVQGKWSSPLRQSRLLRDHFNTSCFSQMATLHQSNAEAVDMEEVASFQLRTPLCVLPSLCCSDLGRNSWTCHQGDVNLQVVNFEMRSCPQVKAYLGPFQPIISSFKLLLPPFPNLQY